MFVAGTALAAAGIALAHLRRQPQDPHRPAPETAAEHSALERSGS